MSGAQQFLWREPLSRARVELRSPGDLLRTARAPGDWPMCKPYVICHMAASVDGRILPRRWRPKGLGGDLYERLHERLGGQGWLVGRITGQEFAKAESYPA